MEHPLLCESMQWSQVSQQVVLGGTSINGVSKTASFTCRNLPQVISFLPKPNKTETEKWIMAWKAAENSKTFCQKTLKTSSTGDSFCILSVGNVNKQKNKKNHGWIDLKYYFNKAFGTALFLPHYPVFSIMLGSHNLYNTWRSLIVQAWKWSWFGRFNKSSKSKHMLDFNVKMPKSTDETKCNPP